MARTTKKGLSYFPLDVDFFEDDKVELINAEFGLKGENIAIRLLCLIYKNGYWYKLGEDESLLLAKRVGNGVTGALVSEIVRGLVKRSFFDERVFNSFQILTSRGIQERYFEAVERRKTVQVVPEIMLVTLNDDINSLIVNINSINPGIGTQSKVKESKENKNKGDPDFVNPFSEIFLIEWELWKEFKKSQFRFTYKSILSEQAAINELFDLSKGDDCAAKKIIQQSIAKGWKGLFELKNENNASQKSVTNKRNIGGDRVLERLQKVRGFNPAGE